MFFPRNAPLMRRSLNVSFAFIAFFSFAACSGTAQQPAPSAPTLEGSVMPGPAPDAPVAPVRAATPKNVILFVSDGTGPASFTLARRIRTELLGRPDGLALDAILTGNIETSSSDSRVTDSAAGATAFSAGIKSYNGAIAVDPDGQPVGTLLEAAEARGMATGMVVTSRITHATPASFAAHVPRRSMENEIAAEMMTQGIEVLLGGGRSNFIPESQGGRRADARNLFAEAEAAGTLVLTDAADFDPATLRTPVLGLFADSHLAYEIDRDATNQPSLAEMTRAALDLLSESENGFFLMVEGSRIDHAAHGNDAAAHLHDIFAFDDAVAEALRFAEADGETLIVSTSDHETGGLTLGRNRNGRGVYDYYADTLLQVQRSMEWLAQSAAAQGDAVDTDGLFDEMGLASFTHAERVELGRLVREDPRSFSGEYTRRLSDHTLLGWTTTGHTAVDVPLFAFGPGSEKFIGHFANTYVGTEIAELLGLDLDAVTARLRAAE